MKHVFSVFSVACVVAFTLFLSTTNSACKKGDKGDKGDTGTANVQFSNWFDVTFAPAKNTNGDTVAWTATVNAPAITKTVLDSGTVKLYVNAGTATNPAIFPVPFTDIYALSGVQNLNVYYTVGKINMYASEDASTFTSSGNKSWQYRYVVIPGSKNIGGRASTNSAANVDYDEITGRYGIPK
jgi:hypothetical protein